MLKRISAVAAALALGGVAFVAAPAGATTAPAAPTALQASPDPVVVSDGGGRTATFGFSVGEGTGSATLVDPNGKNVPLTVSGGPSYTANYTFKFSDEPGAWKLVATATKDGATAESTKGFAVHRITNLDFSASPDVVDSGGRVWLSGALTYKENGGWKGYGRQPVQISFKPVDGSYGAVRTVTTDDQGRFRVQQNVDRSGWWRAEYAGSTQTEGTVSDSDRVDVRQRAQTSRVSFDASPDPVNAGGTLRLRGKVEAGAWNIWDPVKDAKVNLLFKADGSYSWRYVTSAWTGRDGRFAADVTANASGWWRAEYAGAAGLRGSYADDHVDVVRPQPKPPVSLDTRVISFDAYPEPVKYGKYLSFKGKLQAWDGGWTGYGHQKVTVWFKTKYGSWKYVKSTWTNGSGKFWTKTKATKSGYWKVVFAGNNKADGSSSAWDWVRVKR
ncbi:hypothetical protein [Microtetraspora sp. NBRC 16547]|uniref:hypothetical protein n=1 Tax=Microtetraspora sp. NBRC 16547 TaxID=3030993 RepID=UPI00249FF6CB|nr:hypothetical protein [Microtetraspora sp. NBRC 16547]GLW96883.1 hypothetical protein Misp02_09700 [Microtetraspora sp. NBRC 16547]